MLIMKSWSIFPWDNFTDEADGDFNEADYLQLRDGQNEQDFLSLALFIDRVLVFQREAQRIKKTWLELDSEFY